MLLNLYVRWLAQVFINIELKSHQRYIRLTLAVMTLAVVWLYWLWAVELLSSPIHSIWDKKYHSKVKLHLNLFTTVIKLQLEYVWHVCNCKQIRKYSYSKVFMYTCFTIRHQLLDSLINRHLCTVLNWCLLGHTCYVIHSCCKRNFNSYTVAVVQKPIRVKYLV